MTSSAPALSADAFSGAPWRMPQSEALRAASGVPTMLSEDEQMFYVWLAANVIENGDAIYDLGCFAGGSTARLAAGLRAAGTTAALHAFDFFKASERPKQRILYAQGIAPFDGEDIYPLAQTLLAPWSDLITLHRGDILEADAGTGPIALLVNDATKAPEDLDAVAAAFYPRLVPGKSILIQQDYQTHNHIWIPCQMELLEDHFEPVAVCQHHTIAYLLKRPVTPTALAAAKTDGLSDQQMQALLRQAADRHAGTPAEGTLRRAIKALAANPGARRPWHFNNKG